MKKRIVMLLSVLACGAFFAMNGVEGAVAAEADTIAQGVYIGGVDVSNMTEADAKSAVEAYVNDLMGEEFTLVGANGSITVGADEMGITAEVDRAVAEAVGVGRAGNMISRFKTLEDLKKNNLVVDLGLKIDKQATAQLIYDKKSKLNIEAKDSGLKRDGESFIFVPGVEGEEVQIVESVYLIEEFVAKSWDGEASELNLLTQVVSPRGTQEELAKIKDCLGSFTTDFSTSSSGRAKNVSTAASKINGTLLYPGEEFTFRPTVSPFTKENGYELAGAYLNGQTVESFGGGVCQVATTLYNAVIRAELEITQRHPHSMLVSYVNPSFDAAIAGDYKDLHFKNNYDYPIYIEAASGGRKLTFRIYGCETRPENRKVSFVSEVLSEEDAKVEFNVLKVQKVGYWNVEQSAHKKCEARLWKVVTVDGVEQSREIFNTSSYRSSPKIISIGVAGASEEQLARIEKAIKTAKETRDVAPVKALIKQIKEEIENPEPVEPEDPVEPEEPVDPVDPVEPEEPVDPVEPEEPVDPVEPQTRKEE